MAKDDYFVLVYKFLAYLYDCLKGKQQLDLRLLQPNSKNFPVSEDYFNYIIRHMYSDELIEGVALISILGQSQKEVKILPELAITPKGIEYLQENSTMQKIKNIAKGFIEIIPNIGI